MLERQLFYLLLSPKDFAKKFNMLFSETSFEFEDKQTVIQLNHCVNPFCHWYGMNQKKFEGIKNKPSRYKLRGKGKDRKSAIVCIPDPENKGKTLSCSVTPVSNVAVSEEIKGLVT